MNLAAHPEANRLVYRIRTAITGESLGLETAKLAWQYAVAIERANAALAEILAEFDAGRPLEALVAEQRYPRLAEAAASLDFEQRAAWAERCQAYAWRAPGAIDSAALAKLKERLASIPDHKEFLYGEYRTAVRAKNAVRAYQIATCIAERFPEDANAKQEAERHKQALLEQLAKDVKDTLEQLIPNEDTTAVIARYHALDLPLSESSDTLVVNALCSAIAAAVAASARQAESVIAQSEGLTADKDWQSVERAYLACDYDLAVQGARGKIDNELRAKLDAVGTSISRIRNSFEAEISLRAAIADLRAAADQKGPKSQPNGKKAPRLADRLEKLRSLEKQAIRISGQLSPALQEELKAAYQFAKRKRLPALAVIAASSAAAVLAVTLIVNAQREKAQVAAAEQAALAALQQAESSQSVTAAQTALEQWSDLLASEPPDSPLVAQAGVLSAWVESQSKLESEYKRQVDQLEMLARSPDPLVNQRAIEDLSQAILRSRRDLSPELGREIEARYQTAFSNWQAAAEKTIADRTARLGALQREILVAAKNAGKTQSRDEFDRLRQAADQRIEQLVTLAAKDSDAERAAQLTTFVGSIRQDLGLLDSKWSALANEKRRLAGAADLNAYLDGLERIHSFDILPPDSKTAIEQTLRLRSAFGNLLQRVALPDIAPAREVFGSLGEEPYWQEKVALTDAEKAYLEKRDASESFKSIYVSTVQYYQGSANPQSQYSVYLVEPVAKSDEATQATDVSFTFRVLGFDEVGAPEKQAKDVQFITRSDGSIWGFVYKPSELSPESKYYRDSIVKTLSALKAGANRSVALDQVTDLDRRAELSPAFRAYWQETFLGLMRLDPWKWGLALSPTLQDRAKRQSAIAANGLSARTWLSTIEQTVPSPEFESIAAPEELKTAAAEIAAVSSLYQKALAGVFRLVGQVTEGGEAALSPDVKSGERLWSVNALTGRVERLAQDQPLTPFAPLLSYQCPEGDEKLLLDRLQILHGQNLRDERFAPLLPPLFR